MLEPQAGLTWSSGWAGPLEGPFTLLAKLRTINRVPARTVSRLIFGKGASDSPSSLSHSRSYLTNRWINSGISSWDGDFRIKVASGTLDNVLGDWAKAIASDAHLRYCPTCLTQGYQSALCQIDALERCPAHGDALVTECGECGAPTPRYALETAGNPMHCSVCQQVLAEGWNCKDDLRWHSPPAAAAYVELASVLVPIKSARWIEREAWDGVMQVEEASELRILQFEVLRHVIALDVHAGCFAMRPRMRPPVWLTANGWGRLAAGEEFADLPQSYGELNRQSVRPREFDMDATHAAAHVSVAVDSGCITGARPMEVRHIAHPMKASPARARASTDQAVASQIADADADADSQVRIGSDPSVPAFVKPPNHLRRDLRRAVGKGWKVGI
jgi:hypothetical protein